MAPTQPTPAGRPSNRRLRPLLIGAAVIAAIALVVGVARLLDQPKSARKPTAQQIQLVRPSTPPPPPKPPERPPEPPKVKEEVKVDTPRPQEAPKPSEAPPPAPLGVDATGSGQGDGFGLAANPGGRDLTAAPQIGGGGTGAGGVIQRAQFASYRDQLVRHVNEELNRLAELKTTDGQLALQLWIDKTGRVQRVELRDASERQIELIRGALVGGRALREPPPDAMPQPVWVLINLRELG
jgi:periplasmic protein TonB